MQPVNPSSHVSPKTLPDFSYEIPLWRKGYTVIGMDEVGRGALAGPVYVAAATIGPCEKMVSDTSHVKKVQKWGIQDSKKISEAKRKQLVDLMRVEGVCVAISSSDVSTIDRVGIAIATEIAAKKAVSKLIVQIEIQRPYLLADAFYIPDVPFLGPTAQHAITKGDEKSITVAAASIFAKIARDKYMTKLAEKYPQYHWKNNKGYGTKAHQNAILDSNICEHHRKLFVRKLVTRL